MTNEVSYPSSFARSIRKTIQFKDGWAQYVIDLGLTEIDFYSDESNHRAIPDKEGNRYEYTAHELEQFWICIECARRRVAAFYLVDQGEFKAFDFAYASLPTPSWN